MDQIEQKISLPPGALPMKEYARYYAQGPRQKVMGVYAVPSGDPIFDTLSKAQRIWLDNFHHLPSINDGGCSVIEFSFEPQSESFEHLACNGDT